MLWYKNQDIIQMTWNSTSIEKTFNLTTPIHWDTILNENSTSNNGNITVFNWENNSGMSANGGQSGSIVYILPSIKNYFGQIDYEDNVPYPYFIEFPEG
jgi:hypothetical protein